MKYMCIITILLIYYVDDMPLMGMYMYMMRWDTIHYQTRLILSSFFDIFSSFFSQGRGSNQIPCSTWGGSVMVWRLSPALLPYHASTTILPIILKHNYFSLQDVYREEQNVAKEHQQNFIFFTLGSWHHSSPGAQSSRSSCSTPGPVLFFVYTQIYSHTSYQPDNFIYTHMNLMHNVYFTSMRQTAYFLWRI